MPKERKPAVKPKPAKPRNRPDGSATGEQAKPAGSPLTARQQLFVAEYLKDQNATAAYKRAGYTGDDESARRAASRLLTNADIRSAVETGMAELRRKIEEETGVSKTSLVRELWSIVTADARELIDYQRRCCRHCYGIGFRFQRTEAEMEKARASHALKQEEDSSIGAFDEEGGTGFDGRRDPNPECPECFGRGYGQVEVKDTRFLSEKARALYAGVKVSKEGIEVKMHSKLDAAEKIARHLGLYEKDNEQQAVGLAALLGQLNRSSVPVVAAPPADDE